MTFEIVVGYWPEVDFVSEAAEKAGLRWRWAAVLDTYRPDLGSDMYYDSRLSVELIQSVLLLVRADHLKIVWDDEGEESWEQDEWPMSMKGTRWEEGFRWITAYRQGSVVCYIELERYDRIGGPDVYHDAVVIAFYTAENLHDELLRRSQEIASRLNANLEGVRFGTALPSAKPGFWTKLKRLN